MSKRIDLVRKLQKEMDRRTEIENIAIQLVSEGKCEEATAMLDSLDDNVVKGIVDELEQAEETQKGSIKLVLEGLEAYKRNMGIAKQEMNDFKEKVRELNEELEQLNKHMEIFAELRKKIF